MTSMYPNDCWDCQTMFDEDGGFCEAHRPKVDRPVEVLPEPLGVDSKPKVSRELRRTTTLSNMRKQTKKGMGKS